MKVQSRPTSEIVPYARNPRTISDAAVAKLAGSIKEFGFQQPLVVDEDTVIIVGHTRLLAAQKLGLAKVPVVVVEGWSEAKKRAYRIADNRVGQETSWELDMLSAELAEFDQDDALLDVLGFDGKELDELLADDGADAAAEEAPPVPEDPITQPGDLWLCGRHRLLCGDATNADDVAKAMGGVEPHLMVTDPPYGVEYDATWRTKAGLSKTGAHGVVHNDDRADWREAWALFPGDVAYVWHADVMSPAVATSLEAVGYGMRALIVWGKTRLVIGRGHYHHAHEPCWYAVRAKGKGHWSGGRKQSTLWTIEHLKSETGHSTQKPIECMKRPIENNSSRGQAVYDPFLGSGTTMIAAELTGRACIGIEIDPGYCDVAVERWEKVSGEKATRDMPYDAADDSKRGYDLGIAAQRKAFEAQQSKET